MEPPVSGLGKADVRLITFDNILLPKGGFGAVKGAGIEQFRARIVRTAPFLAEVVDTLADWNQVKLLTVQVNRLGRWWQKAAAVVVLPILRRVAARIIGRGFRPEVIEPQLDPR